VLKYEYTKQDQWIEEAARTLKTAEALSPDSVAVLLAGGRFEKSQSHYEDALQNYQRVRELRPRNVEVLLRIAEIDNSMSHGKEAIDNYRAAILLDPGYYETYEEFGVFYYQQGEYARAAEQFRKVIEHAPRFYSAYTNLGATLSDMGQDEAAVRALQTSIGIKETGEALNSLAAIKAYQKKDGETIVLYRKAAALNPRSYICLMNLGDSCRRQGLPDEARHSYQRGQAKWLWQHCRTIRETAAHERTLATSRQDSETRSEARRKSIKR
jgi:superkiller protein 3